MNETFPNTQLTNSGTRSQALEPVLLLPSYTVSLFSGIQVGSSGKIQAGTREDREQITDCCENLGSEKCYQESRSTRK